MNTKKIRAIGAGVLILLWAVITAVAWFQPPKEMSESERRPLSQMPDVTFDNIWNGKFMTEFESYTLDQFTLRDRFRQVKSLFHKYALNQSDTNDIYIVDGYAAVLEYPYSESSIQYASDRFNHLYEKYLKDTGSKIYSTVVPDKGYFLAQPNGYLSMDYTSLVEDLNGAMPWSTYVDIMDCLSVEDYYYTDTHWRQESLFEVAQRLCQALDVTAPNASDFTKTAVSRPFYGVYYGQAALPMEPETMYVMESQLLSQCQVYDYESGSYAQVYDMNKLTSRDLYDVFLSGSRSLLRIENPNAKTDRELIVFRDSFGSSIVPLLVEDYATVTLVDIRYISIDMLDKFMEFHGQDVLFLYSTLVLNNSSTIK